MKAAYATPLDIKCCPKAL